MILAKAMPHGESPMMIPQQSNMDSQFRIRSNSLHHLPDMEDEESAKQNHRTSSWSWTSNVLRAAGFMSLFVLTAFLSRKNGA